MPTIKAIEIFMEKCQKTNKKEKVISSKKVAQAKRIFAPNLIIKIKSALIERKAAQKPFRFYVKGGKIFTWKQKRYTRFLP